MEFDKLTEEEKQQYISEAVKTHSEYEPNFNNFEKFKQEIEMSEYNEYIEWEAKYLQKCKDVGYISTNNKIQGEICEYCRSYGETKLFDTQSKLLKHMIICKHNPNNIKNILKVNVNCIYCNRYMGSEHNLNLHQEKCKMIAKNKINTFNCVYCEKSCGNQHNLNIHQEKCKNIVKCQYCQRELKTKLLMPTHLENCDSYITYLQNIPSLNLDTIAEINDPELQILVKNTLK
jgi:hypothetical protein